MDPKNTTNGNTAGAPVPARTETKPERGRRWEMSPEHVRYFLPKANATLAKPELGEEVASEGEALVQAFQRSQVIYTLVAWKPVADTNGRMPTITKQAITRS